MAKVRRAKAYSKRKPVINSRKSKQKKFSYVKSIPEQKIKKLNMGDVKGYEEKKYGIKASLITLEDIQIRDMALEAARQTIHKDMVTSFQNNYFLKCHPFPHNILRNNRVFSGGSKGERIQTGMSKSFGSSEGRAATVRKNNVIFSAYFNGQENIHKVREFLKKAAPKLPCKTRINFEFLK